MFTLLTTNCYVRYTLFIALIVKFWMAPKMITSGLRKHLPTLSKTLSTCATPNSTNYKHTLDNAKTLTRSNVASVICSISPPRLIFSFASGHVCDALSCSFILFAILYSLIALVLILLYDRKDILPQQLTI